MAGYQGPAFHELLKLVLRGVDMKIVKRSNQAMDHQGLGKLTCNALAFLRIALIGLMVRKPWNTK